MRSEHLLVTAVTDTDEILPCLTRSSFHPRLRPALLARRAVAPAVLAVVFVFAIESVAGKDKRVHKAVGRFLEAEIGQNFRKAFGSTSRSVTNLVTRTSHRFLSLL